MRLDCGGWRWAVRGVDGALVAESVEVFAHPAACGYALHDLRCALARYGLDTDATDARAGEGVGMTAPGGGGLG